MFVGKLVRGCAVAVTALLGLQLTAAADPVHQLVPYEGVLENGIAQYGDIPQSPSAGPGNALYADYWMFWATAGDVVTVEVKRQQPELDPAFYLYDKTFVWTTGTGISDGTNNLENGTHLINFSDDEMPPAGGVGPWGDPHESFVAPLTGWYTVAIGEYASWSLPPGDYDYDYRVKVEGNTGRQGSSPFPEPALAALALCGICGVAVSRRRRKAA
jgi:hypothetical protein